MSAAPATQERSIPFIFGIRGVSAGYVAIFHLNNMVIQVPGIVMPIRYQQLTNWLRYGDFRVAAFFVISGFLLTIPVTRSKDWRLTAGVRGFMFRRAERLLVPYYAALALSLVLFLLWAKVVGAVIHPQALGLGILAHVLLIHNLDARTMVYISDPLWNVALEFQCYLFFALLLLPAMRRFGVWRPFAIVTLLALVPHFLFHGWLDYVRPWFVILYALGVATSALANPFYPSLQRQESRVPWGLLWIVTALATPVAVWASGLDAPYGAGWLQNLLLGLSVSSFFLYVRHGTPGIFAAPARFFVHALQFRPLQKLGTFSYSIYLVHFPILRLLVGVTSRYTLNGPRIAALAFFVYLPLTIGIAYLFHVNVERPFMEKRAAKTKAPAEQLAEQPHGAPVAR